MMSAPTGYESCRFSELEREAYRTGNQLALEIIKRTHTEPGDDLVRYEQKMKKETKYKELD